MAAAPAMGATPPLPLIDMHVHAVGNGSGGSGCWLRARGGRRLLAVFILRHFALPLGALSGDLERLYLECLLRMIRTSSIRRVVLLAQDQVYDDQGRLMEGVGAFHVPNDYVLALAKTHPELLPAVSIHPARPDAMDELQRCLAEGAVLMKCLPNCQNIDCSSRRHTRFWERMAEAGLPLLAHTGGEHTLPIIRPEFADPRVLEAPLQCGVTVIAAHCGTQSGLLDPDYFPVFVEMIRRHPNLYGDCSALTMPFRGGHVPECLREPVVSRIVHGSDLPVPVLGEWSWVRGLIRWPDYRRCRRLANLVERDYQLKRAMGFPAEVFTRVNRLLRPAPGAAL